MSWFTPIPLTHHDLTHDLGDDPRTAHGLRVAGGALASAASTAQRPASGASLGSARAASQWSWATAPAPAAPAAPLSAATAVTTTGQGACLRAPVELLTRMSQMASATGRSESEVWIEAAREWLLRRRGEPNPAPVAPAQAFAATSVAPARPAAPVAPARRSARVWAEIDALLIELRAPAGAQRSGEGAPAA